MELQIRQPTLQPQKMTKAQRYLAATFYELRRKKSLSEIKVIELCTEADVDHSTFYKYYKDIYDFNRKLEKYTFISRIYYDVQEKQKIGIDFPIRFANFVMETYPKYKANEKDIFIQNMYDHNISIFKHILGKTEEESKREMPLFISTITALITYVASIYNLNQRSLTEIDDQIVTDIWDSGIRLILKHYEPTINEDDNERVIEFKKQLGLRYQNRIS